MRDFLNKLLTQEAAPGFNGEVFLEAEKVSDWKVVIDTRRKVGVQTP
jgi:hypothetical protein